MLPNTNPPSDGIVLTMDQLVKINWCGEIAASFETACWTAAGIASGGLAAASLSTAIKFWRAGLAAGEVAEREALRRAVARGNAAASGRLYADRHRAPGEAYQRVIVAAPAGEGSGSELEAEIALQSVDDSVAEQRKLLLGLD